MGHGGGSLQHPFSMWVSPWHLQVFFLYLLPHIQCLKRNQEICEKVAKLWHFFICYENKGIESRSPETELHLMRLSNSSKTAKEGRMRGEGQPQGERLGGGRVQRDPWGKEQVETGGGSVLTQASKAAADPHPRLRSVPAVPTALGPPGPTP